MASLKGVRLWTEEDREVAFEAVLTAMAEGKTLEEAVEALPALVPEAGLASCSAGAMRRWMGDREEWFRRYVRVRKLQGQALADEALRVARESTNQSATVDRVLIDTLKWAAGKANPWEFGDRQVIEHQGSQKLEIRVVEDDKPTRNQLRSGVDNLGSRVDNSLPGRVERLALEAGVMAVARNSQTPT